MKRFTILNLSALILILLVGYGCTYQSQPIGRVVPRTPGQISGQTQMTEHRNGSWLNNPQRGWASMWGMFSPSRTMGYWGRGSMGNGSMMRSNNMGSIDRDSTMGHGNIGSMNSNSMMGRGMNSMGNGSTMRSNNMGSIDRDSTMGHGNIGPMNGNSMMGRGGMNSMGNGSMIGPTSRGMGGRGMMSLGSGPNWTIY